MAKPKHHHQVKLVGKLQVATAKDRRAAALHIPITVDGVPNLVWVDMDAEQVENLITVLLQARAALDNVPMEEPVAAEKITSAQFDALGLDMVFDFIIGSKAKPPGVVLKIRHGGLQQALSGKGAAKQVDLILNVPQAELLLSRLSEILHKPRPH